jgi:hypothetical protein
MHNSLAPTLDVTEETFYCATSGILLKAMSLEPWYGWNSNRKTGKNCEVFIDAALLVDPPSTTCYDSTIA